MFNLTKTTHSLLKTRIWRNLTDVKHLRTTSALNIEPDGDPVPYNMKVKVDILGQDTEVIMFQSYSSRGFKLNNGLRVLGPCLAFPRAFLRWDVTRGRDLTPEHFALFRVLTPKPDILVIGVGDQTELNHINPDFIRFLRTNNLNIEILSTPKAVGTFNFLNSEKRLVVGAMIPTEHISVIDPEPPSEEKDFIDSDDSDGNFTPYITDQRGRVPDTVRELRILHRKTMPNDLLEGPKE